MDGSTIDGTGDQPVVHRLRCATATNGDVCQTITIGSFRLLQSQSAQRPTLRM